MGDPERTRRAKQPIWGGRHLRAKRKSEKRHLTHPWNQMTPTKRQWVVCVQTTAIVIPPWALERAVKELSTSEHHIWFRGRCGAHAKVLAHQDRMAGGNPVVTNIEYRKCAACGRMLLNLEAEYRRKLDESCWMGRKLPCSAECGA